MSSSMDGGQNANATTFSVPSATATTFKEEDENEDGYLVYLCFEQENGKECSILGFPYLCCACPNGRAFCSHCLAMLHILRQAQTMVRKHGINHEKFIEIQLEVPTFTQKQPMLLKLLVLQEQIHQSMGQVKRHLEQQKSQNIDNNTSNM